MRKLWRSEFCCCSCCWHPPSLTAMFRVLTAPPFFFLLAAACLFCWLQIFIFPPWMLGIFWWCQLSTWSYLLRLSPRSCFGSLRGGFPPKGAGYTDLVANKRATGEVTEKWKTKSRGFFPFLFTRWWFWSLDGLFKPHAVFVCIFSMDGAAGWQWNSIPGGSPYSEWTLSATSRQLWTVRRESDLWMSLVFRIMWPGIPI